MLSIGYEGNPPEVGNILALVLDLGSEGVDGNPPGLGNELLLVDNSLSYD